MGILAMKNQTHFLFKINFVLLYASASGVISMYSLLLFFLITLTAPANDNTKIGRENGTRQFI